MPTLHAASRGDADAIYEMMTTSAQKSRSREDVKRLVKEQRVELSEQAKLVTARDARVEATARLRYEDGEEASARAPRGTLLDHLVRRAPRRLADARSRRSISSAECSRAAATRA